MTIRLIVGLSIASIACMHPAGAEAPPYTAMKKIASSFGEAASDLYACEAKAEAHNLRRDFFEALPKCDYSKTDIGIFKRAFEDAASARYKAFQDFGGSCEKNISARYNAMSSQVEVIEKNCAK